MTLRQPDASPSLALVNARLWTGDARRPWADALLVGDARIIAIGSSAEIRKRTSPGTRIIDAGRRLAARAPAEADDDLALRVGDVARLVVVRDDLGTITAALLREAHILLRIEGDRIVDGSAESLAPVPGTHIRGGYS